MDAALLHAARLDCGCGENSDIMFDMDNPTCARICRAQAARPLLKYVPNECMIFPAFVNALTFRNVGNELARRWFGI